MAAVPSPPVPERERIEADDGKAAVRLTLSLKPDVVIMDLMMPILDGIETTRRLVGDYPDARVLILTTFGTSDGLSRALSAGARGAILKNSDVDELLLAVRATAKGEHYLSAEIEQIMADDPPLPELTARQKDMLEAITRGLSNADIAKQRGISEPVVKEHVSLLFRKLGVSNRAEAVAIALRKQLLKI